MQPFFSNSAKFRLFCCCITFREIWVAQAEKQRHRKAVQKWMGDGGTIVRGDVSKENEKERAQRERRIERCSRRNIGFDAPL